MGALRSIYIIFVKYFNGIDNLRDSVVDEKLILKWILQKYGVTVWIELAQDREQWRAVVNTNSKKCEEFH
jgi:hypothetical protein